HGQSCRAFDDDAVPSGRGLPGAADRRRNGSMKRLTVAAGAAAVAASLTLASAAPGSEPADGFVYDAMTAPATVSYSGTVESVDIGDQHSEAVVYRIVH